MTRSREVGPDLGFWDRIMDIVDNMGSEDVMDRCEVVSLESLKTTPPSCLVINANDRLVELVDECVFCDYVHDTNEWHKDLVAYSQMRGVEYNGCLDYLGNW